MEIKAANNTDTMLLMEAVQADWRAIGVDAPIVQNEGAVAFAAYRNRDFQAGAMSWYADFNDPVTFLGLLKSDTGAQNYGDYNNPAYDAALAKGNICTTTQQSQPVSDETTTAKKPRTSYN